MQKKTLNYNGSTHRWEIIGEDYEYELHCGNYFEVLIGGQWIRTTIEMRMENGVGTYYLTTSGLSSLPELAFYGIPVRR